MAAEARNPAADGATAAAPTVESLFKRRIAFHPARKPYSPISSAGDFHLETLNPGLDSRSRTAPNPGAPIAAAAGKRSDGGEFYEHGLDPELSFRITFRRIGAGLANLGNTCFLNSVLQCLTYTEPFAAYLQSGKHKSSCHTAGFCAMCALQNHVMIALQSSGKILSPLHLVKNLRCISRSFCNSRQEDAHEYMVNLLESMHKCCLPSGVPSESPSAYERSLVHKIFGGRLRSQVKCMQCSYCSNKFDPFLDLSLEIVKADSLRKALAHFTAVEQLDGGERQYQCQRCKGKVRALKQLTIHKPPYVLTIHLKRFSSVIPGQKIDRKVEFEPTLDLKTFVSDLHEGNLKYTLYGVLIHAGWSTHSGHYYCFVRTSSGMWHSLDDNQVFQVSEKTVLAQKAYMLFYVRDSSAIKRSVDVVHKDNIPANGLGNKVIPQSASGINGSLQNRVVDRKLSASEHSSAKSKTDSTSHVQFISVTDNSSGHPIQKEASFQKNDKITLKEALVLQNNGHVNQKEASVLQSNRDVLSKGLQQTTLTRDSEKLPSSKNLLAKKPLRNQVTEDLVQLVRSKDDTTATSVADNGSFKSENCQINHENYPLSNDCNMEVESGILVAQPENSGILNPTSEKHTMKLLTENGTHANGGAADGIIRKNVTLLKMDSNVSTKSKPTNFSSQSSPMNGCTQKEVLDMMLVEYQNVGLENDKFSSKSHCHKSGESLLKLEETKFINLPKKQSTSGVPKEVLEVTGTDYSVGNCSQTQLKQKQLAKCSLVRGLYFGRKKLFLASLSLQKNKKHKRCKKRRLSSRNIVRNAVLEDNDQGTSTSEAARVIGGDSNCPPKKRSHSNSNSENNIGDVKEEKHSKGDCVNSKDRDVHERSGKNGVMLATFEQLKRCSSSTSNQCDAPETDAHGKCQNQHSFISLLMRGLKETTVARWDDAELQSSQIHEDVQNGNIGYVLDEWDEEYDQGKRKKVKKPRHSFGGSNPFQETANVKTQQRLKLKTDQSSSGNQPLRI